MHDIAVIGGGPAGMTAALYALRAGMSVIVIEAEGFGGQITASHLVENYPALPGVSGNAFADALLGQILEFGAELAFERAVSIETGDYFTVVTEDDAYPCRSVIIATGAKNRRLGLADEERLTGSGVSYCAVCDGAFYRDGSVAVVGGGNTALQDALYLTDICRQVWLIHRRDSFRGEDHLVQLLRARENVEFVLEAQVTELAGADELESVTVSLRDGSRRTLPATGLFVAVGQAPDNSAFENVAELSDGYIAAENECFTKTPGIFTAGDCRVKTVRQLTTAVGDGATAALAACDWLRSH